MDDIFKYCQKRRINEPLVIKEIQNMSNATHPAPTWQYNRSQATNVQFCLHQIGKSDKYCLLRSNYPQKNEPAGYSTEIGSGTVDEMIEVKKQIVSGYRDENGKIK